MRDLVSKHEGKLFRIEKDYPEIGAYLYVFENNRCTHDFLQASVIDCIEFASEKFGVPGGSWHEIDFDNCQVSDRC